MSQSVVEILKSVGAVLTDDHFVYTSGKHGSVYINKDALYPHTAQTATICQMMAEKCRDLDVEVVAAPALGGIILSQWVAYFLSQLKGKEVLGIYAEKTPDKNFMFSRGYDKLVKGKKVLVLEDLTTTGGSVKKVLDVVVAAGGTVTGVCVMVNRDPEHVNSQSMGVPFLALGELPAEAFDESKMPEELRNRPINTTVGHGKKYLEALKTRHSIRSNT